MKKGKHFFKKTKAAEAIKAIIAYNHENEGKPTESEFMLKKKASLEFKIINTLNGGEQPVYIVQWKDKVSGLCEAVVTKGKVISNEIQLQTIYDLVYQLTAFKIKEQSDFADVQIKHTEELANLRKQHAKIIYENRIHHNNLMEHYKRLITIAENNIESRIVLKDLIFENLANPSFCRFLVASDLNWKANSDMSFEGTTADGSKTLAHQLKQVFNLLPIGEVVKIKGYAFKRTYSDIFISQLHEESHYLDCGIETVLDNVGIEELIKHLQK